MKSWPVLLAILAAVALACNDDGTEPLPPDNSVKNLTQRNDVLLNFEAAYNTRRINVYSGLLDADFTFDLSASDVGNGLPASWNRPDEIYIHTRMFDSNSGGPIVQSIIMDIRQEEGVTWIESDSPLNPGEKWYTTTLYYDFKFEIAPNYTWIPNSGSTASFTVRDAGAYGKYEHHWQLVELRDLGGALLASPSSSASETTTLGAVKALFR